MSRSGSPWQVVNSSLIGAYAVGVIAPCFLIATIGLYLLRDHELSHTLISVNHLTRSLGQDLEFEVERLTVRAIDAAAGIREGLSTQSRSAADQIKVLVVDRITIFAEVL